MNQISEVEQTKRSGPATGWPFTQVWCAFAVALLLQSLVLPCLCEIGSVKGKIALAFDLLVLARTVVAWVAKETGRGWLFYTILLYTSAFWIEGVVWVLVRH